MEILELRLLNYLGTPTQQMQTISKKSWDDGQGITNIQQSRDNTRKLLLILSSASWYTPCFQLFTILAQDKPSGWNFSSFFSCVDLNFEYF